MPGHWIDWNELIKILTQQRVHWEGLILQGNDFLIFMSMVVGMPEYLWNWVQSKVKYNHRIIEEFRLEGSSIDSQGEHPFWTD